jgi:HEAT repeat protein
MGALLLDPLIPVRIATLDAMADTGHVSAVTPIGSALEDEDADIREAAIKALGKLGRTEAKPLLKKYILTEKNVKLVELAKQITRKF